MSKCIDLIGQRFGRLVVIERADSNSKGRARWLCQCDCGEQVIVLGYSLRCGGTKSCRCLYNEGNNTKHKLCYTRLYNTWSCMKSRCTNAKDTRYKDYGGRGITICEEWLHDFQAFYDWAIANGYSDTLTIDRKDNDKGYYPDNCRWATKKEQNTNQRRNRWITYNGETKTITDWARTTNIDYRALSRRLQRGWSIEKTLTTKPQRRTL